MMTTWKTVVFGLLTLFVVAVVGISFWAHGRADRTIAKWTHDFRQCHNLTEVTALAKRVEGVSQPIEIRTFDNGEWVAGRMEHSCCSGAGYNANVLYDSRGRIFVDRETSLCGFAALGFEMESAQATSLDTFYPTLTQLKVVEMK